MCADHDQGRKVTDTVHDTQDRGEQRTSACIWFNLLCEPGTCRQWLILSPAVVTRSAWSVNPFSHGVLSPPVPLMPAH